MSKRLKFWWYSRQLKSGDSDIRRKGAEALGRLGAVGAVEPLITALQDSNPGVRHAAAEALDRLEDPRAVEPLIRALRDGYGAVRGTAAAALGRLGDSHAIEGLVFALGDRESHVRCQAAKALANLGDRRWLRVINGDDHYDFMRLGDSGYADAVKPLARSVRDPEDWVRRAAASALCRIQDPLAIELLIHALRDPDFEVRLTAVKKLCHLKDPRAIQPLIEVLGHDRENIEIRSFAIKALYHSGDPRAIEPLVKALDDWKKEVRALAAEAVSRLLDARVVDLLIRVIADGRPNGSRLAAELLGRLRDPSVVEPLTTLLASRDGLARRGAARVLTDLGDRRWAEIIKGDVDDYERLGRSGDRRFVDPLIHLLADQHGATRRAAAQGLAQLGEHKWAEWFIGDIHDFVRLGASGDPAAYDFLVRALNDSAGLAARGLAALGDLRGVEPLDHFLSECPSVDAAVALVKLGDKRGVDHLARLLSVYRLAIEAARILAELGDKRGIPLLVRRLSARECIFREKAATVLAKVLLVHPTWIDSEEWKGIRKKVVEPHTDEYHYHNSQCGPEFETKSHVDEGIGLSFPEEPALSGEITYGADTLEDDSNSGTVTPDF